MELFFGKKPKQKPLPQPKPKTEAGSEFELIKRRQNALQILTNGFNSTGNKLGQ